MTTSNDRLPERAGRHVVRRAERWTMTPMTADTDHHSRKSRATAFGGLLGLLPVRDVALFAHR